MLNMVSCRRKECERSSTYHRAMHKPQIALVSKQLTLVLPAHVNRPRVEFLTLLTRLKMKASAPEAFSAAVPFSIARQLRKLRGLPRTTETMINASRSRESMPVMMNRLRLPCE